jgi:hypothetical protein
MKEDLSDAESAEDLPSELAGLCQPLSDSEICPPDELLVLCPSKLLNIPLHELPVGEEPFIPNVLWYIAQCATVPSREPSAHGPDKQAFEARPALQVCAVCA